MKEKRKNKTITTELPALTVHKARMTRVGCGGPLVFDVSSMKKKKKNRQSERAGRGENEANIDSPRNKNQNWGVEASAGGPGGVASVVVHDKGGKNLTLRQTEVQGGETPQNTCKLLRSPRMTTRGLKRSKGNTTRIYVY